MTSIIGWLLLLAVSKTLAVAWFVMLIAGNLGANIGYGTSVICTALAVAAYVVWTISFSFSSTSTYRRRSNKVSI